jgi:predicted transcriptional regulator
MAFQLCDNCIIHLAQKLSDETGIILKILADSGQELNKNILMKGSNLSYFVTNRAVQELKSAGFVNVKESGRDVLCKISPSGIRIIELYRERSK